MTPPTHAYGLSADKEIPLISGGEELTHLGDTLVPLLDLTQTTTEKIVKSTIHSSQVPLTYDMKWTGEMICFIGVWDQNMSNSTFKTHKYPSKSDFRRFFTPGKSQEDLF